MATLTMDDLEKFKENVGEVGLVTGKNHEWERRGSA